MATTDNYVMTHDELMFKIQQIIDKQTIRSLADQKPKLFCEIVKSNGKRKV